MSELDNVDDEESENDDREARAAESVFRLPSIVQTEIDRSAILVKVLDRINNLLQRTWFFLSSPGSVLRVIVSDVRDRLLFLQLHI